MEGFPKPKLSKEEQALYQKVKGNKFFANLSEDEFLEWRQSALQNHSTKGKTITSHAGVVMEKVPDADELDEIREQDTQ